MSKANYYNSSSPSIFDKLAGLFDKALDLESVIDHPAPYPRIARRKSFRQIRPNDHKVVTMSGSSYYTTRPIAPYGYPTTPTSPLSSSPASTYYDSPSPPYQQQSYYPSPSYTYQSPTTPRPQVPLQIPIEYCCLMPNCTYAAGRKADLERHYRAMHPAPGSSAPMYDCLWQGCHRKGNYGFGRKDKMVDHMREVHKADIPKRSGNGGRREGGSGSGGYRYTSTY
ncbi:unnamed protein product [Cercospora beticola]|nr:unnamed protein product [Cercospora beticola]